MDDYAREFSELDANVELRLSAEDARRRVQRLRRLVADAMPEAASEDPLAVSQAAAFLGRADAFLRAYGRVHEDAWTPLLQDG